MASILTVAGMAGSLPAAAITVDWLHLVAGGSSGAFSLQDDGGGLAASGTIIVNSGLVWPNMPGERNMADGFWGGAVPQLGDSIGGDGSVSGFEVRVAPFGGQANYRIELSVPAGQSLYLMVGELLRTAGAATQGVRIEAYSDEGSANVELIEILAGYEGGFDGKSYIEDLTWNAGSLTLSTVEGADGESRFAFFEISPLEGTGAKIVLSIPESYASGGGDLLAFGLGIGIVPEPSVTLLGGLGALVLLTRRRVRGLAPAERRTRRAVTL